MAVVFITIKKGRSSKVKSRLARRLASATIETLGANPDQVRVIIHEVPDGDYAVGGKPVRLQKGSRKE